MAAKFEIGDRVWYRGLYDVTMTSHRATVIGFNKNWSLGIIVRLDGATGSIVTLAEALTPMNVLDLLSECL
jgi:hypothetical protein